MSIIIYQNEQPFYYNDLGEIIFFSFGQPFLQYNRSVIILQVYTIFSIV